MLCFSKNLSFYNELYTVQLGAILGPFWHREGSMPEPSRAEPGRAGPGRAEPSRAEPSRPGPGWAETAPDSPKTPLIISPPGGVSLLHRLFSGCKRESPYIYEYYV